MIYLCTDKDLIIEGIRSIDGTRCIKEIILLYLDSYGTDYDFNQFYVQCDDNSKFSAVIHRYNNFVYISADTLCNSAELENFISGFSGCQIISDNINFMTDLNSECCYVMSKAGGTSDFFSDNIRPCLSPAEISELVCKDMNDENKVDFLLNTAHQIRHDHISVYGYFIGNKPVCVLSCTNVNTEFSVLTFARTLDACQLRY